MYPVDHIIIFIVFFQQILIIIKLIKSPSQVNLSSFRRRIMDGEWVFGDIERRTSKDLIVVIPDNIEVHMTCSQSE